MGVGADGEKLRDPLNQGKHEDMKQRQEVPLHGLIAYPPGYSIGITAHPMELSYIIVQ
jgi:hypothetical protein